MEFSLLLVAIVILLALEIYLIRRRKKKFSKRDLALVRSEWEAIRGKIERDPKHAIIEADKLLDFVLKKRGFSGSLGDKLQRAEKWFSHADDIWSAHKLRNRCVHEIGFDVTEGEARKALSQYKQALWDLGVKL
ncbi:hypothetical protein HYW83_02540 [Candidatus Peregrinibacteria bacterium]|nr:hypothetical protein [Candidatus Peregrinibacteria bacterium]